MAIIEKEDYIFDVDIEKTKEYYMNCVFLFFKPKFTKNLFTVAKKYDKIVLKSKRLWMMISSSATWKLRQPRTARKNIELNSLKYIWED